MPMDPLQTSRVAAAIKGAPESATISPATTEECYINCKVLLQFVIRMCCASLPSLIVKGRT